MKIVIGILLFLIGAIGLLIPGTHEEIKECVDSESHKIVNSECRYNVFNNPLESSVFGILLFVGFITIIVGIVTSKD